MHDLYFNCRISTPLLSSLRFRLKHLCIIQNHCQKRDSGTPMYPIWAVHYMQVSYFVTCVCCGHVLKYLEDKRIINYSRSCYLFILAKRSWTQRYSQPITATHLQWVASSESVFLLLTSHRLRLLLRGSENFNSDSSHCLSKIVFV